MEELSPRGFNVRRREEINENSLLEEFKNGIRVQRNGKDGIINEYYNDYQKYEPPKQKINYTEQNDNVETVDPNSFFNNSDLNSIAEKLKNI